MSSKIIVILGAGWAGLPLAHKLLKYTLPKTPIKVILISPNTHFYWNVAAVRGIIPNAIPDSQLFLPIEAGFQRYPAKNFDVVLGKATGIDVKGSTVEVLRNDGRTAILGYDQLVIATGSQMRSDLPFKPLGKHEETLDALHAIQNKIETAKSILIAGGGPTGVETAGELAAAYGMEKQITLAISEEHVLQASQALPSVVQALERNLQKLGVKLLRNAKVESAKPQNAKDQEKAEAPQTNVRLHNGQTLTTDLYLPLFGIKLNTSFVPPSLVDLSGNLTLDQTMRVRGTTNIWGIGDVGNLEPKQLTVTDAQIIHLAAALDSVICKGDKEVEEYKLGGKKMIFITMGRKYATGQIGGWRLWGWLTAYVKGRYLFVDTAPAYVNGERLRHASM
jgi:apoptosis-inducing factor 2